MIFNTITFAFLIASASAVQVAVQEMYLAKNCETLFAISVNVAESGQCEGATGQCQNSTEGPPSIKRSCGEGSLSILPTGALTGRWLVINNFNSDSCTSGAARDNYLIKADLCVSQGDNFAKYGCDATSGRLYTCGAGCSNCTLSQQFPTRQCNRGNFTLHCANNGVLLGEETTTTLPETSTTTTTSSSSSSSSSSSPSSATSTATPTGTPTGDSTKNAVSVFYVVSALVSVLFML
jgi:hypothetical protein